MFALLYLRLRILLVHSSIACPRAHHMLLALGHARKLGEALRREGEGLRGSLAKAEESSLVVDWLQEFFTLLREGGRIFARGEAVAAHRGKSARTGVELAGEVYKR